MWLPFRYHINFVASLNNITVWLKHIALKVKCWNEFNASIHYIAALTRLDINIDRQPSGGLSFRTTASFHYIKMSNSKSYNKFSIKFIQNKAAKKSGNARTMELYIRGIISYLFIARKRFIWLVNVVFK